MWKNNIASLKELLVKPRDCNRMRWPTFRQAILKPIIKNFNTFQTEMKTESSEIILN